MHGMYGNGSPTDILDFYCNVSIKAGFSCRNGARNVQGEFSELWVPKYESSFLAG